MTSPQNFQARFTQAALARRASTDRRFSAATKASYRLAARKLIRAAINDPGTDLMARMQVLEGVAGVGNVTDSGYRGPWSQNPSRGVKEAEEWFRSRGHNVRPEWFQKSNTGMIGIVSGAADKLIRGYPQLHITGDDLTQDVLFGLGSEGKVKMLTGPGFWYIGQGIVKSGVLSGREYPKSVAGPVAWHVRAVGNSMIGELQKRMDRPSQEDEDDKKKTNPWDSPDIAQSMDTKTTWEMVFVNILSDPRDRVGKEIRKRVQQTWSSASPNVQRLMNAWLENWVSIRPRLDKDIAAEFGTSKANLSQARKKYFLKARDAIKKDVRFRDKVYRYVDSMKKIRMARRKAVVLSLDN